MTIIWIIIFTLTPAGVSAGTTVTGHRGQSVQIRCPYDSRYETNIKYLCRGECSVWRPKVIPVQSGSAEDQRFSLHDDTTARVFTINITDLRPEDEGRYWCGIKRPKPLPDLYTEVLLLVKTVRAQFTHHSSFPSTDVQSSITAQRNPRRDWDTPDHEYDVPGNQHSVTMSPVYESLNPNTSQPDSVYQRPRFNSNQSDSIYQGLNPNTNQSDSEYQSLNLNTNQSDSVYHSLNPNTIQSN